MNLMRTAISILLAMILCPAGCKPEEELQQAAPESPSWNESFPQAQAKPEDHFIYVVQLKMITVEVPVGAASGSDDLWSHLDEEPVHLYQASLGRNGFRVGRASAQSWPEIRRTLQRLTGAEASESSMWTLPNTSLTIVLKSRQGEQTIFTSMQDRTLSGMDYPAGDNLLTVQCNFNADEPDHVVMIAQPQIRTLRSAPQIVQDSNSLMIVHRPKVFNFPQLTFQLSVPNNDLVIVGPGDEARRPGSVANHFLMTEKQGLPFETVLIMIPSITRAASRPTTLETPRSADAIPST
jgi:hypothetical protein